MRARIVLNCASGAASARCDAAARKVVERFRALGVAADATQVEAGLVRPAVCAALASSADLVVVGGGDGSVSAAASAMVGQQRPLGVLPLGTWNHFARDLGMPKKLEDAVDALVQGAVRAVDVGELNGHVFVNSSSIGIYPDLVVMRELEQAVTGHGKWSALASAAARVARRLPVLDVCIATGDRVMVRRTPFVFVGNNDYGLRVPWSSARPRLDAGALSLYVVDLRQPVDFVKLGVRALLGRLEGAAGLERAASPRIVLWPKLERVRVAMDGEVFRLAPPLHYRIRPRALRVMAPAAQSAPQSVPEGDPAVVIRFPQRRSTS